MREGLVQRLRDWCSPPGNISHEAADRIELLEGLNEVERNLRRLAHIETVSLKKDQMDRVKRMEILEAALREIAHFPAVDRSSPTIAPHLQMREIARQALKGS